MKPKVIATLIEIISSAMYETKVYSYNLVLKASKNQMINVYDPYTLCSSMRKGYSYSLILKAEISQIPLNEEDQISLKYCGFWQPTYEVISLYDRSIKDILKITMGSSIFETNIGWFLGPKHFNESLLINDIIQGQVYRFDLLAFKVMNNKL